MALPRSTAAVLKNRNLFRARRLLHPETRSNGAVERRQPQARAVRVEILPVAHGQHLGLIGHLRMVATRREAVFAGAVIATHYRKIVQRHRLQHALWIGRAGVVHAERD